MGLWPENAIDTCKLGCASRLRVGLVGTNRLSVSSARSVTPQWCWCAGERLGTGKIGIASAGRVA